MRWNPFQGYEEHAEGDFGDFIAERDEALLSMDPRKILNFFRRYHVQAPATSLDFWVGVHKSREATVTLPEEARQESRAWLARNGFLTYSEALNLRRN